MAKMIIGVIGLLLLVLPVMGEMSGSSMSSGGSMMSGSSMSSGGSMMSGGSMAGTSASGGLAAGTPAAGYTQSQQEVIQGMGYGFFMGKMAGLASLGYNVTGYNAEADRFNAWIQQKFGNDPNLLMPKMPETGAGMPSNIPLPPRNSEQGLSAL